MDPKSRAFKDNARKALTDETLASALGTMKAGFRRARAEAIGRLPEFDALRDAGRDLKNHVLDNLDFYLETFEAKVIAQGGHVHWCRDAAEAREAILAICRDSGAKTVTKGKSMITEEIGLNAYLEANGVTPIETDLGEYIIQLRGETPSHIVAPAIHLRRPHVAEAFRKAHTQFDPERRLEEHRDFLDEARAVMRGNFLAADVGITGANMMIAETGSTVIVTNEGNGDLTQLLPRVHVVVASLEKIVPTLDDAALVLRLLARSASGQDMSAYTTFSTGPRRPDDVDGPDAFHVVLLDNGRSDMLGTGFQEMLRCIRCAACMNHCPVYGAIGGHAYGWVYPGPMGSVLTPALIGLEQAADLPNASTLCGRCEEVCPMRIPLPRMLRHWREKEFERHLTPKPARFGLGAWAFVAARPGLYRLTTRLIAGVLSRLGGKRGHLRSLGLANGWTAVRAMPAPEGRTFMDRWRQGERP
ncbi:iron-sulfur cluster-binding protein [Rhodospirillum rubrum]|uniref:LutB/LldF family L-lactate oxidation iron-sulfur protein n=1 Tax=Rhodospirillum rubrum TaxID=1085 RepID=UPI001903415D|nr:LutB/LldF family L-lactate oxidation iron-sulfur protein [Rhodospirillum rubrum]MBK1663211.1 iron-sulfur cluster-binding protein [Rhodospirillum rubrum]MBK1676960.1 iron-sulfur cluster-binding protein [Rhodospirillum rubrum]